jgi:uncharacterized protein
VTPITPDPEILVELANTRMPFGKYKGSLLLSLPDAYLAWFARQGFPKGRLGMLMETALEVRLNGLESLVRPLIGMSPKGK